jgi:hypothetical protein
MLETIWRRRIRLILLKLRRWEVAWWGRRVLLEVRWWGGTGWKYSARFKHSLKNLGRNNF